MFFPKLDSCLLVVRSVFQCGQVCGMKKYEKHVLSLLALFV